MKYLLHPPLLALMQNTFRNGLGPTPLYGLPP